MRVANTKGSAALISEAVRAGISEAGISPVVALVAIAVEMDPMHDCTDY